MYLLYNVDQIHHLFNKTKKKFFALTVTEKCIYNTYASGFSWIVLDPIFSFSPNTCKGA